MAALRAILPYLAVCGWALLAFFAGQLAATGALIWWWHGDLRALFASPYDGVTVTLSVLVLNPVTIGVLLLAIRAAGANPVEYLALAWPRMRDLAIGIVGIVIIIAATDAVLYLTGRPIVSSFQVVSYTSAAAEGWLALMFFATVIVAPAGEEVMFRGYLFRGFARSERTAWPAIVVISLLWTLPHLQYDWTGMAEIFVAGLFLGWVRWRSDSTLLTFLLHALFNLEGTIETILQVKYFPD
jgi:membrane protease YdiL (CAAX protease family)